MSFITAIILMVQETLKTVMGEKILETKFYLFGDGGDSFRSYTVEYLTESVMLDLRKAYVTSSLIDKLISKGSKEKSVPEIENLRRYMRWESLADARLIENEWRDILREYGLTLSCAKAIDDKLSTIEFLKRELILSIQKILDTINTKVVRDVNLGNIHWRLLVDIEELLYSCRSTLDIFARLTKSLYCQMYEVKLPDDFGKQVNCSENNKRDDTEYFNHIASLDWFPKLKEYRDDVAHKTSLKIVVEPPPPEPFNFYLKTTRNTKITFHDLLNIIRGISEFSNYYVCHFRDKLQSYHYKEMSSN